MVELVAYARRARVEAWRILEYVERRIVPPPSPAWSEDEVEILRRVRRLSALGVNLAGIEVILHMRSRLDQLLLERERLMSLLAEERRRRQERERTLLATLAGIEPDYTEEG